MVLFLSELTLQEAFLGNRNGIFFFSVDLFYLWGFWSLLSRGEPTREYFKTCEIPMSHWFYNQWIIKSALESAIDDTCGPEQVLPLSEVICLLPHSSPGSFTFHHPFCKVLCLSATQQVTKQIWKTRDAFLQRNLPR